MISAEQHERERDIAEKLMRPRPCAAYYAGRCACGARWLPGDVIFRPVYERGAAPCCLDCGIAREERAR